MLRLYLGTSASVIVKCQELYIGLNWVTCFIVFFASLSYFLVHDNISFGFVCTLFVMTILAEVCVLFLQCLRSFHVVCVAGCFRLSTTLNVTFLYTQGKNHFLAVSVPKDSIRNLALRVTFSENMVKQRLDKILTRLHRNKCLSFFIILLLVLRNNNNKATGKNNQNIIACCK